MQCPPDSAFAGGDAAGDAENAHECLLMRTRKKETRE